MIHNYFIKWNCFDKPEHVYVKTWLELVDHLDFQVKRGCHLEWLIEG